MLAKLLNGIMCGYARDDLNKLPDEPLNHGVWGSIPDRLTNELKENAESGGHTVAPLKSTTIKD